MTYIGNTLQTAQPNYQIIDDISASFDSITTTFALQVGGITPVPFPISAQHCMISVGGVIQQPDPTGTEGFRLVGGDIVFSSAPNTGEDFFGVILAGADYVNVGVNYPSGSESAPSITFDTDLDTGIYNPAANELGFSTNSVQRLKIESDGDINIDNGGVFYDATNNRLGIGTTNPNRLLTANGIVGIQASGTEYLRVYGQAGAGIIDAVSSKDLILDANGASNSLLFYQGGAEAARIDSSKRLLVGTTTATSNFVIQGVNGNNTSGDGAYYSRLGNNCNNTSSYHLRSETQGVNNWYLYGNGTTSFTSDERKKKNIETTRDGYLEDLLKLRVVKYNWLNQEDTDPKELGLIAQEVEQVFPGLVQDGDVLTGDAFPTKVLKASVLPFMLLKALQEAAAKIETLEAEVAALKAQ